MASSARIDELRKKFDENPRRYFAPLANEYRKAGDLSQAIFICQEYLPQQPGHMSGHIVYGQALYEMGRPEEAQVVFETALSLDPENLIALRHLGDIARQANDFTAARAWYQRVLEADPRNEEIAQIMLSLLSGPEPVVQPTQPARPEVSSTAPTPLHTPVVPAPSFEASQDSAEPAARDGGLFVEKSAEAGFGTPTPKSTSAADSPGDEGVHGGHQHARADAENLVSPLVAADGNEFLDLDDLTFGGMTIGSATDSPAAQEAKVEPAPQPAEDNSATVAGFETFEGGSSWTRSPDSETANSSAPRESGDGATDQTYGTDDSVVDHNHLFAGPQDSPEPDFEADPFAIARDAGASPDVNGAGGDAKLPQPDSRAAMGIFDEFPQSAAEHGSSTPAHPESHVGPVDLASAIEFLPADQGAPSSAGPDASARSSNDVVTEAQSPSAANGADDEPGTSAPSALDASSHETEPVIETRAFDSFAAGFADAQTPETRPSEAEPSEAQPSAPESSESDSWHRDSFDDLATSEATDRSASGIVHAQPEADLSLTDSSENAHPAPADDTPEAASLDSAVVDAEHAPSPDNQSENAEFETASSDTAVPLADQTSPDSTEPELSTGFTETAEFAGFGESGRFVDVGAVDPAEADTEEYDTEALASENASNDVPVGDDHLASAPAEAFVTETMAELYLQQGHLESALGIYQRLFEQRPGDVALQERMRAVEDRVHGTPAETVAEPTSPTVAVYGGPTIRDFLRGLASMRPAERAPVAGAGDDDDSAAEANGADASGEASGELIEDFAEEHTSQPTAAAGDNSTPETDLPSSRFSGETTTTTFDELFGSADAEQQTSSETRNDDAVVTEASPSTPDDSSAVERTQSIAESTPAAEAASPAPLHGLPAHRATSELSLDHVFKRATPARADTDAFSLDRFFSTDATAADAKPQVDGRVPPAGTDDIAQFNAWLNGLKKT